MESFSCGDWDRRYNDDNCVPISQRCDGIKQCFNGKDEHDCHILLETPESSNDVRAKCLLIEIYNTYDEYLPIYLSIYASFVDLYGWLYSRIPA